MGATPLHYACVINTSIFQLLAYEGACARMLLNAGANVNAQERFGDTPLICAAKEGLIEIVSVLLEQPTINLNVPGYKGDIAIVQAAKANHPKIVELLQRAARGGSEV